MKIQNIHISSYKNITEQTLILSGDKYTTLIGTNGSGKSNWLEAISAIFLGLYMKQPNEIEYRMEYSLGEVIYQANNGIITQSGKKVSNIFQILPDKVIACYSGEDQRLWNKFYKPHYDKFFNDAVKNVYQEPEMIYINKDHWIIALISLLCSEKPEIKQFLSSIFGIEGEIDKSEISVSLNLNAGNIDKFKQTDAVKFVRRLQAEEDLRVSHIASYEIGAKTNDEFCRKLYFYLYLLSLPIINEVNKVSKAIEGIDISINGYNIDSLSEGHKKLILIKFITSIIGTENSLILLDEPDAHTHIASKRDILTSIQNCSGQTILTTHSPVFINMMDVDSLRYVEHGKIVELDIVKAFTKIADDGISILEGALYAESGLFLLVEGKSDVACLKAAIDKLTEYQPLSKVAIYPVNGANQFIDVYRQVFQPYKSKIKKLIFLFDYDGGGYDGWTSVLSIVESSENIKRMFYQKSYDSVLEPTTKPGNDISCLLEDLFPIESYKDEIDKIHSIGSFHDIHKHGSITESGIKKYIEKQCHNFKVEWFEDFKPLLTKLMELYNLNI